MGKYDYDYNFSELLPLGKIASNVPEASVVLEFGCYTGGLAKHLKEEKNCQVYAIELDEEAFNIAKEHLVDGLAGDIEDYYWVTYFSDIKFDVLIFADVLEHLRNPGKVLEKACSLLKEDGIVLFSIPNIAHNDVIVKLLENRFDYTETGLLDSTHIHFWGGANLKEFFQMHGMFLAELDAHTVQTETTEQSRRPAKKYRDKNFKTLLKNRLYGEVYQFVGKAYKQNYAREVGVEFVDKITPETNAQGAMCKVYYNTGNGFNEEECLVFYREIENDTIDITAHVPEGTTEIRFDPIEGMECVLYDVAFRSEYVMLDYEVRNGRREKECIVFLTTDPQIRIDFKGRKITSLTATARILCLDGITSKYVRTLLDDYDSSCSEEAKKRIQAETELKQLAVSMQEQEEKWKSQYEEQLAVEKETMMEMRNKLIEMQKEAEENKNNTILKLQEKAHQNELQLSVENARLEQSNGFLEKEVAKLNEEVGKEREKRELLQKQLHEKELSLECENIRLKQENTALIKDKEILSKELKAEHTKQVELQEKVYQTCKQYEEKKELLDRDLSEAKKALECAESEVAEEKKKYTMLQEDLEKANIQIKQTQELLSEIQGERDALLETKAECQQVLEASQRELAAARTCIEQEEVQRQQLVNDYRGLESHYFAVVEEKDKILNTKSWRYTKGFRIILSKIKQNRFFNLIGKVFNALKLGGPGFAMKKTREYLKRKKRLKKVSLQEGMDCSEICFETLVFELEQLSSHYPITIYNKEKLIAFDSDAVDKNVLLVSHTLDLTGGPVAVRYFAKKLLEDGYSPVVFSPNGGGLVDTLVEDGIPVVVFEQFMTSDFIVKYVQLFSFAVLNTIVCAPLISSLSGLKLPIIWWVHEAKVSYHPGQVAVMPKTVGDNINIYCGGEYARKMLLSNFPNYEADTLLYYVPDYLGEVDNVREYPIGDIAGKKVFASIGVQEERKGQDILANAILAFPKELVEKCYFVFVGRNYFEPIAAKIRELCEKYPLNVKHIPEVSPDELKSVYKQIDCLVCTSRDDPMPIVVTEAFLMKKVVICSENAGSAQFIQDGVNGFVYHNDNYMELMQKIQHVVEGSLDLKAIGEQARLIYESNFGKTAFNEAIDAVVSTLSVETQSTYDVSVVIPTYNGGEQFKEMLNALERQKNCGSIEIVVVDSGSKDGTVEACLEHNVNLVQIPNDKFSHSYARNLGAESANGKIIAFMTQDAMPSSDEWLFHMTEPIVSGEVSAVSCGEQCPEGTDLYYRIASFGHARYVGFFDRDMVGSIENCTDDDTLRRNASLNDVACIIERRVFMRFKHRFNYAEDLDLGIRLLKKGYKIKMLSGVKVIHAHNRVADYYMKRAIVENEAFYKIFPGKKAPEEDETMVVSRIVRSTCMMSEVLAQIDRLGKKHYDTFQQFIKDSIKIFEDVMKESDKYTAINKSEKFQCPELEKLVEFCQHNYRIYDHPSNINPVWGVRHYLENSIVSYVEHYGIKYTKRLKNDICGCLLKQFAFAIGAEISNLGDSGKLKEKVKELTKGV